MDLTPGEKAVLGQIRVLYSTSVVREQQLKALMMQWPPVHCEAYKKAYGGLLAKALIQDIGAQVFRITDAGFRAIGITPVAQSAPRPVVVPRPPLTPRNMVKPKAGFLSRVMSGLFGART